MANFRSSDPLGERPTVQNLYRLGVLPARLHEHAATFRPPSDLPVRTLHELIGRGEREVLFTHDIPLFVPSARRVVFERIAERFRQEIDALYAEPAGRRVIHADLTVENVKVHRGRLRPLDFYETSWGYPIQDAALTLFDLRFFADCRPHGYAALRDAFADGYMSRMPWPEQHSGQIDALVAGRRLRQANLVLLHEAAPSPRTRKAFQRQRKQAASSRVWKRSSKRSWRRDDDSRGRWFRAGAPPWCRMRRGACPPPAMRAVARSYSQTVFAGEKSKI